MERDTGKNIKMIELFTDEFKQQVRSKLFSNVLVKSGIVHVVDKPMQNCCVLHRKHSWEFKSLFRQPGQPKFNICACGIADIDCHYHKPDDSTSAPVSTEAASNRIGVYFSYQTLNTLTCIFRGVIEAGNLTQKTLEESDHPVAFLPTHFQKTLPRNYYLCPFTRESIRTYSGKRLVWDDMCFSPILFYPGEVKLFINSSAERVEVDPNDSGVFTYWREYHVSIKGFDYVGPAHPNNTDLTKPESWKRNSEKSLIVRID